MIDGLNIKSSKWYIDCNLGGGGHTKKLLAAGGKVLGIDLDAEAIREVAENHNLPIVEKDGHLECFSDDLILIQSNFANIQQVASQLLLKDVGGILFDLGVSSYQLESSPRGFSFNSDAPLDMRMDQNATIPTAADLVNGLHEGELSELFWKLGEENFAKVIARKIVEYRKTKRIETTDELARVILAVRRRSPSDRTHPATRVFQALRIAVNDELNSLKTALPASFNVLDKGGVLAVISFHSLEDRIVKDFFKKLNDGGYAELLTKKPLTPSNDEVERNPRSRSGKLRLIKKLIDTPQESPSPSSPN